MNSKQPYILRYNLCPPIKRLVPLLVTLLGVLSSLLIDSVGIQTQDLQNIFLASFG